jgi:hypothetical protein
MVVGSCSASTRIGHMSDSSEVRWKSTLALKLQLCSNEDEGVDRSFVSHLPHPPVSLSDDSTAQT